ncbi:hypothetical protein N8586_04470, partial [Verrucomicrobiales bacterium]|nr:hypothetical protein [Verrucomicrobiales bacterium]
VLVELVPTSFPYNAGSIVGMNRWGAPFTQLVTSKGESPENRIAITDLSGKAKLRYLPDPDRINEHWQRGKMQDMMTRVLKTGDSDQASFARAEMRNPMGLPVRIIQDYVSVRNRFLVRRETVVFEESFHARVAALWNTQNIGPQIGDHWANTFMTAPVASNGKVAMRTPPADLLVYFSPQPNWRMQVVDRTAEDPRTAVTPAQLRYVWEGTPTVGQRLHSTQVYYPHAATKARVSSNQPGAKAEYAKGDLGATAGASGITVIRDDLGATVLKFQFEADRVEWVTINHEDAEISVNGKIVSGLWDYATTPSSDQ